jgi:predicted TIM-barrel fold metal-dependent hydrolase
MIIDAHCHFWLKESISDDLIQVLKTIANKFRFDFNLILDGSAERLIGEMNEAGIDKTILLAVDGDLHFESKITFREYNNILAKALKKFPDRLIGLAGIDPRRGKSAIQELERCVEELGFRGVKLWPLTGFYPDDLRFYPFYERVQELGAIILCHTGLGPSKTYLKYCRPAHVDTIAVDFPEIKIIMAHMGDPWTNEAIAVASKNPNVYIDISAWEPAFKMVPFAFFQTLIQAKMSCGIDKILFGSDWPLFTPILSLKEWVEGIKKIKLPPPLKLMGLPELTEDEKNKILGENAAKLLEI